MIHCSNRRLKSSAASSAACKAEVNMGNFVATMIFEISSDVEEALVSRMLMIPHDSFHQGRDSSSLLQ